jgi:transcriptional regulator with XRE-family HTH domain
MPVSVCLYRQLASCDGYTSRVSSKHESVGAQIKRLRKARKWSLSDLAEASGVEKGTIGRIELGKQTPHPSTARTLIGTLTRPSEEDDGQQGGTKPSDGARIEDHLGALLDHVKTLEGEDRRTFIRAVVALFDALEHARPRASSGAPKDDDGR